MTRARLLGVGFVGAVVFAAAWQARHSGTDSDAAAAPSDVVDLGVLSRGPRRIEVPLRLANHTGRDLHAVRTGVSCPCVKPGTDTIDIAAGETRGVSVGFEVPASSGRFRYVVSFQDPATGEVFDRSIIEGGVEVSSTLYPRGVAIADTATAWDSDAAFEFDLIGVRDPGARRWTAEIVTPNGSRRSVPVEVVAVGASERRSGRLRTTIGPAALELVAPGGVRRGVATLDVRGGGEDCAFSVALEVWRRRE